MKLKAPYATPTLEKNSDSSERLKASRKYRLAIPSRIAPPRNTGANTLDGVLSRTAEPGDQVYVSVSRETGDTIP